MLHKGPFPLNEAKARAVINTLKKARKSGFIRLHFVLDAHEMLLAFKGNYDWSINLIISYMKAFTSLFYFVDFAYIPRTLNGLTHRLAELGYSSRHVVDWGLASSILLATAKLFLSLFFFFFFL